MLLGGLVVILLLLFGIIFGLALVASLGFAILLLLAVLLLLFRLVLLLFGLAVGLGDLLFLTRSLLVLVAFFLYIDFGCLLDDIVARALNDEGWIAWLGILGDFIASVCGNGGFT